MTNRKKYSSVGSEEILIHAVQSGLYGGLWNLLQISPDPLLQLLCILRKKICPLMGDQRSVTTLIQQVMAVIAKNFARLIAKGFNFSHFTCSQKMTAATSKINN